MTAVHFTRAELAAGVDHVRRSPSDAGVLELIVARTGPGLRAVLDHGELTTEDGLVGDDWRQRGSRHTLDGGAEVNRQLTLMNARAAALFAGARERWALAGDQLYVDFDLSVAHVPAGTALAIGAAVVEVSPEPHTGCAKFIRRFGRDALHLVQTEDGQRLRLRGLNARVVVPGAVRPGDVVTRIQ